MSRIIPVRGVLENKLECFFHNFIFHTFTRPQLVSSNEKVDGSLMRFD